MKATRIKQSNTDTDENESVSDQNGELITAMDESDDEEGSVTYIEDYEMTENDDPDGDTYFVEYVNDVDDDGNLIAEQNDIDYVSENHEEVNDFTESNDDIYNCNLCGMNFKDVKDHIEKYHADQEFVIEMDEMNSSIKLEKNTNSIEYDENEIEDENTFIGGNDDVNLHESEMIIYSDEQLENENSFLNTYSDDDTNTEVYTYDNTTESLTKAPSKAKTIRRPVTKTSTTTTANVCEF